jgi:hypothetical protein
MALKLDMKTQMLRFTKRLKGIVENASSKEVMKEVGEQAVRLIQQDARKGNDYKGGKFKPLSADYMKKRAQAGGKKKPPFGNPKLTWKEPNLKNYKQDLHPVARPRKSNVTATGQLIDSIEVSKIMERSVEVECSGSRSPSAFDSGKLSNAEVAYYVEKAGRHFLGLSDKSKEKIRKFYDRIVKTILRRQR